MKTIKKKKDPFNGRVLNARPDTIDFRDRMYTATLNEVPSKISLEKYMEFGVPILDQGKEGACTGFGLATMIHYLLRKRTGERSETIISPRMLYEMAKKYDEWEGEDYIGSSARGAIKGWHKHGVCEESKWKYSQNNRDKNLTNVRAENAAQCPIGSYYRVNHKDLIDMHTAIAEVGILFATARVHDGWFNINESGIISYDNNNQVVGGHAFAIVAYDANGFWIQNSWGPKWGKQGFAQISYDDWLANGTDIWVGRLGVPVYLRSPNSLARSYSVASSTRDGMAFKDLRQHVISLGNDGKLKTTGTYGNFESDVERIFSEYIPEVTKDWTKKRIMLYAHGGLVSEKSVLQRLADYRQSLLANEIYPIFFVWNTDMGNTLKNLVEDAFKSRKSEERVSSVFDFMLDRIDDALEPLLRLPDKTAWDEMKENALAASGRSGGASLFLKHFLSYASKDITIHLVGHSAGSILLGPIIEEAINLKIKFKSCTLWAPACTMDLFEKYYLPAIKKEKIGRLALFTLSDDAEQNDNCFYIYNKSLLYLVSNSFETVARGTEILGMEKYINTNDELKKLVDNNIVDWIKSPNTRALPESCEARHHGDFDNDIPCFNSTVKRILLADPAPAKVERTAKGAKVIQEGDLAAASLTNTEDGAQAGTDGGNVPRSGNTGREAIIAPAVSAPQIKMRPSDSELLNKRTVINNIFSGK